MLHRTPKVATKTPASSIGRDRSSSLGRQTRRGRFSDDLSGSAARSNSSRPVMIRADRASLTVLFLARSYYLRTTRESAHQPVQWRLHLQNHARGEFRHEWHVTAELDRIAEA